MPNRARAHHLKHPKKKDPFDYVVYFFMVATPMFELPQVYSIYSTKDAGNVSIFTWAFFLFASAAWATYAIKRKLVPLMVTSVLYFSIELFIVAGILMYQ